jgi:hypothetical protein
MNWESSNLYVDIINDKGTSMNKVTKDGIEVQIGQVWKNCDRRNRGEVKKVVGIIDAGNDTCAILYSDYGKRSNVKVRRMYKHSTGWELVQPNLL